MQLFLMEMLLLLDQTTFKQYKRIMLACLMIFSSKKEAKGIKILGLSKSLHNLIYTTFLTNMRSKA